MRTASHNVESRPPQGMVAAQGRMNICRAPGEVRADVSRAYGTASGTDTRHQPSSPKRPSATRQPA